MNTLTQQNSGRTHDSLVRDWVAANRGAQKRIAAEFGVSQPFVSDILYRHRGSRDERIEQRLASLGAPGFEEYSNAITE